MITIASDSLRYKTAVSIDDRQLTKSRHYSKVASNITVFIIRFVMSRSQVSFYFYVWFDKNIAYVLESIAYVLENIAYVLESAHILYFVWKSDKLSQSIVSITATIKLIWQPP